MHDLRRRRDHGHDRRGPAEVLFWTLGPKQVGRAAIAGWCDFNLLPIGEVSRRSGVASSALRFYEERGLITSEQAG